jgi:hypothetical protein
MLERVHPVLRDERGEFVFIEKVSCDTCRNEIITQPENGAEADKYRHGAYPGHRCTACTSVANHEYDRWATGSRVSDNFEDWD